MVAPHVSIKLPNGEEMSGSTLRDAMRNLTPESFKEAMGWFDKNIYEMLQDKIDKRPDDLSELISLKKPEENNILDSIFSIIQEVYSEKQRRWACSQIDDPRDLTKKQAKEMCYSKGLKKEKDLEELRTNISGFYGHPPDPKKRKKKYNEPALQDDYKTDEPEEPSPEPEGDDYDFEELEELSAMAGGSVQGYSLPLGAKPPFNKKKKRKNK